MTNPKQTTLDSAAKAELREKYLLERDKRLRVEGNEQYVEIKNNFDQFLQDPHTPIQGRDPVTDHVTFTFIGGGFAGLVTGARLKEQGITDVRIVEKGGDFGGTWYWNRYPGAQCDTASFVYMPLLEETGHMPTEKYAHGPEILAHCQRIGQQFELYEQALFHTEVTGLKWLDDALCWQITTQRGDCFTSQFVGMGTGPLHVPKLPGIPGLANFKGKAFHTSRWDYNYTGGDANGAPMTNLQNKRVAIIGTGATSVQCVPHLAKSCETLYVFQRTPSSVDVRNNQPTDEDWFNTIATPGWQQRWLENFTANQTGGMASEDLVMDGWTDLSRRIQARIRTLPEAERTPHGMMAAWEDSDYEKMNEIRARVDDIVKDPKTAEGLKAWYRQLCKRPCFHDDYLDSFNEPGTHLLHTDGKGVEQITETGLVANGVTYEVDCIIYASGFEVGTEHKRRAGFDLTGRGGHTLSDHWRDGMKTLHGTHVHGFPNAFIVQPTQGANLISNVPHNLTESGQTIALTVRHTLDQGHQEVEVTDDAEAAWVEILLSGPGRMIGSQDCTPGYYNNEGLDPGPGAKFHVGYPQGASAYFEYLKQWRSCGQFSGLSFRDKPEAFPD